MSATLLDLSNGGAAVRGAWRLPEGQEIERGLPGGGGIVSGRVVRCGGGGLAVVFRLDSATAGRVGCAAETLGHRRIAA